MIEKASLQVEFGGYSTAGLKPENQDAFGAYSAKGREAYYKGLTAAIADGVSVCERGAEASHIATNNFLNDYYCTPETWTVKESAARVLNSLNSWLYQQGTTARTRYSELVTTFDAIVFKSNTAHIFHIGDSSIWRFYQGNLERLTRDHTIMQKNGGSALSRALGMDMHLEADYKQHDLREGELYILMTDGVDSFLPHKQIKEIVGESYKSLEQCAQRIVNQALSNGSDDNLSCLLCRVDELPKSELEEAQRNSDKRVIPPVLQVGNKLDDFVVDQILYSGTRSHLYRVHKEGDTKKLVLKSPSANFSDDAAALESFVREEWIGQQLNHPNIMQVYKKDIDTPFMYNLYEFLPSQDLAGWIQDNPQPNLIQMREVLRQICSGLRAFQRQSMVHRDLKPENIMIDTDGNVKLIDFGTVKVNGLAEISTAIQESAPVGSVNYIAPEYLMGQQGHYRSDIFSVGVIAYEMLCGELPFKAMNERQIPSNFSFWNYRSIKDIRPDIPDWIDGALRKACAPNPNNRYEALSEFFYDMSKPNNSLVKQIQHAPLAERNPVLLWQMISGGLAVALIASLVFGQF